MATVIPDDLEAGGGLQVALISEKDIRENTKDFVSKIALGADTFARTVAFAINEPDDVDINKILFRPTDQPV